MFRKISLLATLIVVTAAGVFAQETVVVRPVETQEVLVNPGMGIKHFKDSMVKR